MQSFVFQRIVEKRTKTQYTIGWLNNKKKANAMPNFHLWHVARTHVHKVRMSSELEFVSLNASILWLLLVAFAYVLTICPTRTELNYRTEQTSDVKKIINYQIMLAHVNCLYTTTGFDDKKTIMFFLSQLSHQHPVTLRSIITFSFLVYNLFQRLRVCVAAQITLLVGCCFSASVSSVFFCSLIAM